MSTDLTIALAVLAGMLALFVSNRWRLDLVALVGLLALVLTGVITTTEAVAGFSDPVVLMIAGLFVVGAGLFRTGVADAMGRQVEVLAGGSTARLTAVVMLVTAVLSGLLSSTGTVAVMLPVVLAIARRRGISPSLLLMPVAYAALLGGMLTLIGTPPNLIVSGQLVQSGMAGFGFFSFLAPGLVMLLIGMAYMLLLGRLLLPERQAESESRGRSDPEWIELFAQYGLNEQLQQLRVPRGSLLAAADVSSSELRSRFGVTVLAIASTTARGRFVRKAEPGTMIRDEDDLYVVGRSGAIAGVVERFGLRVVAERAELPASLLLVDAVVPPRSAFIGRTLRQLRLHSGAGVTVLAQRTAGSEELLLDLDRPLAAGDALLLTGSPRALRETARSRHDLVLLEDLQEDGSERAHRAPVAIAIMLAMMALMTTGLVSNVIAVMLAAVALVISGCVRIEEAYRSINFEAVVLIAAILPMATALDKTGGLAIASEALMSASGQFGPLAVMAVLFVFTAGLSQVISNTATTVLVAPVALQAALALEVSPYAMLMTIAIAASSAFATPVASPVNTLVLSAGGYRFMDFVRVGVPLQVVMLLATLAVVPLLFPL
ncbi:SLC13 family permease [Wenzhouxiangella limi]|uniref:SLC13 family permease n=1 Tax=Wenzhouxiangella limi TaxID=2707351 RepID=A0A845VDB4_9GAMM|nr:SLC13 family permease [Wenzhouxiangella limi]NDY95259.1 SLC13 family permease [Wenzhouxiangella limi]